ncbi:hypothetical protein [Marinobacter sp.]|uniref:hypothetical protein n=1 Tax=Marinobacter sp. TaxID=50741 RepID=UPI003568D02A
MTKNPVPNIEATCPQGSLIPVDEWKLPETSVRRSLKDAFRHILAQIRAGVAREDETFKSLDNLPELARSELQSLAPQPDARVLATSLSRELDASRSVALSSRNVIFLVAPPFSGVRSALENFPQLRRDKDADAVPWTRILPPENVLLDEQGARDWWDRQDLSRPWVIPELADFWLRHLSGLALIHELLRRVSAGGLARGLIGCSSWCWQFWSSYFEGAHLAPLTPAPMTAAMLGDWFQSLASGNGEHGVIARMADDGLYVLPMVDQLDGKKRKYSGFLRDLASVARGNPGVAFAIWQQSLRASPEEKPETVKFAEAPAEGRGSARCWVVPFDQLSLPVVPQIQGDSIGLVLHALLLHDGLDASLLALATGIPEPELGFVLARLARSDLIERADADNCWKVTAFGYPSIRRHLDGWGYPVDSF